MRSFGSYLSPPGLFHSVAHKAHCGLARSSVGITWELVQNADSFSFLHPGPADSKSEGGTGKPQFIKPSKGFLCTPKFNDWPNRDVFVQSLNSFATISQYLSTEPSVFQEALFSVFFFN